MAKKVYALLMCLALMLCLLSGCSSATKEYTCQELTMTVPLTMRDQSGAEEAEGFTFALSNSDVAIFGLRETLNDLGVDESFTISDYADAVIYANDLDSHAISRSTADYMYIRYSAESDGATIRYLAGIFKAGDAFWMVQVAAELTDYEEETFFTYLDSVKFN